MLADTHRFLRNNEFIGAYGDLAISIDEFKEQWLYGIPLCNQVTGKSFSDDAMSKHMIAAQTKIENELNLKLIPQFIHETKDYIAEEFRNWGYVKTTYPILSPCKLSGRLNERPIIEYPKEWLSVKRTNPNGNSSANNLYIVPNGQNSVTFTFLATNYPHYFQIYGARIVPNYWQISYVAGFQRIPDDLLQLIGLITSMWVLPQLELTAGVGNGLGFGLASSSLSLDGLSQSTSKINGGNIFQNRLKQYSEQFTELWNSIKGTYRGIVFDVM